MERLLLLFVGVCLAVLSVWLILTMVASVPLRVDSKIVLSTPQTTPPQGDSPPGGSNAARWEWQ